MGVLNSCRISQEELEIESFNILCLVAEDISPYLGCYGDSVAYTPNLDWLANEGIMFTSMYSVSGVCAPSRNALITGMYPSSIGGNNMRTNNSLYIENVADSLQVSPYECTPPSYVKCFTEYLRSEGYYCINNEKEDYQFKTPKSAWDESSRHAHWRNNPTDKPFFAVFNFMRSHESQIWNWLGEPLSVDPSKIVLPPYYPDDSLIRRDMAQMYTNITIMDFEVGEIISQLEEDGLLDKTIIIFYSDHGGPMPRGKREILDSGTRVPFIVRLPNSVKRNEIDQRLHSFVDIPPTILSLANVEIPDYMQGQAFMGPFAAQNPRQYVFSARDRMDEWYDCRRSVRDKRYRYVRNYRTDIGAYQDLNFRKNLNTMNVLLEKLENNQLNEDQKFWFRDRKEEVELYDLWNDPYELNNIAHKKQNDSIIQRLDDALSSWLTKIDDKGIKYQTEKELVESMWPKGKQPETSLPRITSNQGKVSLECDTEGASIVYQINNAGFNRNHWFLYTGPFQTQKGDTITALAHRIGYLESAMNVHVIKN